MKRYLLVVALAATALCPLAVGPARAAETPIDVSSLMNTPWTGPECDGVIANGDTFPTGNQNLGGVPFAIPTGPNNTFGWAQQQQIVERVPSASRFPLACRASLLSLPCSTRSGASQVRKPICS